MTDFRALCAELTDALDTWLMAHHYGGVPPQGGADAELVLRARAALAQAEPPNLKEQALLQVDVLSADLAMHGMGCDLSQIRRALEQLPDD